MEEIKSDNKISAEKLLNTIISLPTSLKQQYEAFVKSKELKTKKVKRSIDNIFVHLSFYLSHIDFDLLEYIIEQFGSEHLKKDMSCYAHDMTQFKTRTTISDALKYLPKPKLVDRESRPQGFSHLTVEFDMDINVVTLEKLDELRKIHANEFQLSNLAFFLYNFERRSLLVTWLVLTCLETIICDKIQEKNVSFFSNNNILELSLDGKKLYSFKKEV